MMSIVDRFFDWWKTPIHYSSGATLNRGHRVTVEGDHALVTLRVPGLDGAARLSPETARAIAAALSEAANVAQSLLDKRKVSK